jgi:hypothetical protein
LWEIAVGLEINLTIMPCFINLEDLQLDALSRGAYFLDPLQPQTGHYFDVGFCKGLEKIFEGKDVLDLGAGLGYYGRCLLHDKQNMFPETPKADEFFFE